jgi:hypothetical protein
MTNRNPSNEVGQADTEPRPAAVSFVTTEPFDAPGPESATMSCSVVERPDIHAALSGRPLATK